MGRRQVGSARQPDRERKEVGPGHQPTERGWGARSGREELGWAAEECWASATG